MPPHLPKATAVALFDRNRYAVPIFRLRLPSFKSHTVYKTSFDEIRYVFKCLSKCRIPLRGDNREYGTCWPFFTVRRGFYVSDLAEIGASLSELDS